VDTLAICGTEGCKSKARSGGLCWQCYMNNGRKDNSSEDDTPLFSQSVEVINESSKKAAKRRPHRVASQRERRTSIANIGRDCKRCKGFLHISKEADGLTEVVCLMCGWRAY